MKLDKPTLFKIFGLIAGGILLFWALEHPNALASAVGWVCSLLFPLGLGLCIAFVLNVPMRFLERHIFTRCRGAVLTRLRRPVCILLSLVFIAAVLTAVFLLVIPELLGAFSVLARAIPVFLARVSDWAAQNSEVFPTLEQWLASLQIDWNETGKALLNAVTTGASDLLGGTVQFVTGLIGGITNAIIGFIFAMYILLGKENLKRQTALLCRAFLPERAAQSLFFVARLSSRTFASFVTGQCTEACILGTLCWLGMLLFRFPYAPMVGALVGISALIPIVGAVVGTVVGAFMIMMVNPMQAVAFVAFLLVLQQIEGNLIYPRVVGSSVGLPPIWVLAAVTLGGSTLGIVGMLFAVPVCSIVYSLVRLAARERLARKADACGADTDAHAH